MCTSPEHHLLGILFVPDIVRFNLARLLRSYSISLPPVGKRHKTGVPYQVKLLAVPLQIIERYRDYPKENPKSVFGEVNYWSVCKKLKPVMKECVIDKPISAHCARHGFATMALTNGMPIESVSRVLGHTNIVTTQIYARITTQKLDNDLTMLGNKLNQSFSNIKRA